MADDLLTLDDCCRMILADWPWRQEHRAAPLRDYKRQLLTIMTAEFGIAWSDDWLKNGEAARNELPPGLPLLACRMPAGYGRLRNPFDDFLEYTPQPGEQAVLNAHGAALQGRLDMLKTAWVALFRDLLLVWWPDSGAQTTTWERLHAKGLPAPVDELDSF